MAGPNLLGITPEDGPDWDTKLSEVSQRRAGFCEFCGGFGRIWIGVDQMLAMLANIGRAAGKCCG